jgi:hypothetical protein
MDYTDTAATKAASVAYVTRRQEAARKAKRTKVIAYAVAAQTFAIATAVGIVISK